MKKKNALKKKKTVEFEQWLYIIMAWGPLFKYTLSC